MSHEIAPLAIRQLLAWVKLADNWVTYVETREDGKTHVCCATCEQAIYQLTDGEGRAYMLNDNQISALTVAHLRQNHQDHEPIIYRDAGIL